MKRIGILEIRWNRRGPPAPAMAAMLCAPPPVLLIGLMLASGLVGALVTDHCCMAAQSRASRVTLADSDFRDMVAQSLMPVLMHCFATVLESKPPPH